MSKSVVINVETQTANGQVISLSHINEKTIALETSDIAQKMFKLNRGLFDKINSTTKIKSGVLYRQEVTKAKGNTNSVYTPTRDAFEFKEIEISRLFFENNILKRQQRAINKEGRKFDFDPEQVSELNSGGMFNDMKISPDDIKASTIITTVEQLDLFQDQGVKSILITDTLMDNKQLLEVGYRMSLNVETSFKDYINYVVRESERSILFLTSYVNSLSYSSNYNGQEEMFNPEYSNRIMAELGIPTSSTEFNLGSDRIKNSEFGRVGISYYNLVSLIRSNVDKELYSRILKGILPTKKTTPNNISAFLGNFSNLLDSVKAQYLQNNKQTGKENKYSRISEGKVFVNSIEATTKERLAIEQEKLGYSVFDEDVETLNIYSSEDYKKRYALEQAKYYPNISVEDDTSFLTPSERSEFSRMDNAPSFLTPTSLIMGDRKVSTARGMKNININDIRQFRLAKSSRAQQQRTTSRPQSTKKGRINQDVLSSLNVTISSAKTSLLDRTTDEIIDPLIDAKHYIGDSSEFVTNNPFQLIKNFGRILTKDEQRALEIASDIIPRRFLRNNKAIRSIKEIQFSNPNSIVRKMAVERSLQPSRIPPHVKFMMSSAFNPNPNSDPMQNRESREIIEETQKNIYVIKALVGFKRGASGFLDLNNPMYVEVNQSVLESGRAMIAKAYDYEVPELGIVKDNFLATIYNNFIYIRGQ